MMTLSNWSRYAVVVLAVIGCIEVEVQAQALKETFLASGVTRKVGGYRPVRSEMDKESDIVKVSPENLEAPRYGLFEIGEKSWAYILDEPEEGDATLYVDTNGDGDLTNDGKARWTSSQRGEYTQFNGGGKIDLGNGKVGAINFYRFDPADKRRASLKNTILFYTDYGYEYSFKLDEREFTTFVGGAPTATTRFPVDRDGNGKLSRRFEQAAIGKPFNFTGTTYVFKLNDGSVSLEKAVEELEQMPLPPNLEIGKKALKFVATTMNDVEVSFPSAYAGKIVMLDFWATWCGPCIGEIPNMKKAYANWHGDGFEILGVSFDRADMTEEIEAFLEEKELPWPQVYEGKMWDTTLGHMHDVSGIPFVLLVDGDSGEILATARQLRGPGLSDFIRSALEKKFDIKLEENPDVAVLNLNNGTFAGLSLGASADEIRQLATKNGVQIHREYPFSKTGTLMDFGGINFRFKEDGTSYQCYAVGKGVAIGGGLKLQESTVSEFEKIVGSTAKKGVAPNGRAR